MAGYRIFASSCIALIWYLRQAYALSVGSVDAYTYNETGYPDCFFVGKDNGHGSVELNPLRNDYFCEQKKATSKHISIACVGDSITAGAHSSRHNYTYPSQLQSLLDRDHPDTFKVTNLGFSGSTMLKHSKFIGFHKIDHLKVTEFNSYSPYWNGKQFEALTSAKWDIVVIMLGTNDAKEKEKGGPNNWPQNCTGDSLSCPYSLDYSSMIKIVKGLGTTPNGPKIHIMIPPPLMKDRSIGASQTVINDVLPSLVPKIAEHNQINTKPIDIYSYFGGGPNWKNEFPPNGCTLNSSQVAKCNYFCDKQSCDQCHPNDHGYSVMAQLVKRGIGL